MFSYLIKPLKNEKVTGPIQLNISFLSLNFNVQ
jgi:hypothetical protein